MGFPPDKIECIHQPFICWKALRIWKLPSFSETSSRIMNVNMWHHRHSTKKELLIMFHAASWQYLRMKEHGNVPTAPTWQHSFQNNFFSFTTSHVSDSNPQWNGFTFFGGKRYPNANTPAKNDKHLHHLASQNKLLQTLDTSSCIAKLEVLLAE